MNPTVDQIQAFYFNLKLFSNRSQSEPVECLKFFSPPAVSGCNFTVQIFPFTLTKPFNSPVEAKFAFYATSLLFCLM